MSMSDCETGSRLVDGLKKIMVIIASVLSIVCIETILRTTLDLSYVFMNIRYSSIEEEDFA